MNHYTFKAYSLNSVIAFLSNHQWEARSMGFRLISVGYDEQQYVYFVTYVANQEFLS